MAPFRPVKSSRLQCHLSHLNHRPARPTSRCVVKALPVAQLRCLQRFLNLGDPTPLCRDPLSQNGHRQLSDAALSIM
jgi:hypothetical protein